MNFKLNDDQLKKLFAWMIEQDEKVAKQQNESNFSSKPYYGCSGGGYTYSFTPTTLGMVEVVTNNITKESINLTEYSDW